MALIFAGVVISPLRARAQVPGLLQSQGRVLVGSTPFDGAGSFKFALVDGSSASLLWLNSADANSDGQPDAAVSLPVAKGLYYVLLGDATLSNMAAIPASLFTRPDIRLRVWFNDGVNGFSVLSPDQRLAASAYALMAASVSPGSIGATQLAAGTLAAANISGTFIATQLPADVAYKSTDLAAATNSLIARLVATNVALSDRIGSLTSELAALTEFARTNLPSGATVLSTDPADPALVSRGLFHAASFPAPAWVNGPAAGEPTARSAHSTVWTGTELIVWGGAAGGGAYLNSGGRYATETGTWTAASTLGAPSARVDHSAVWTGSQMLIWGGFDVTGPVTGGSRFTPSPQGWQTISALDAPSPRYQHLALWTGARMLISGGLSGAGLVGDGALYSPDTEEWTTLPTSGAPSPRIQAAAVWTGTRLVVWGGEGASALLGDGASLAINAGGTVPGAWQPMSSVGAPSARTQHTAVWTGTRVIVWGGTSSGGGALADGAAWNPDTGAWSPTSSVGAPSARAKHAAVWTGNEMVVFGGQGSSGAFASGAAYDPGTDRWRPLTLAGNPVPRAQAGAVWTGSQLLIFGGLANGNPLAALQRIDPQPTWHLYRKP